jgi:diguanylate cyclase (GGDEF)-like protein
MDAAWAIGLAALLLAVLVSGLGWARTRRQLVAAGARSAQASALQHEVLDGLNIGLVVWDADDRLLLWNRDFELVYAALAPHLRAGLPFVDLLRLALANGLVPEAAGREEAWVAGRLAAHRRPSAPIRRRMADGRWRQITERFLPDGSLLSYSVDITAFMDQEAALERARRDAAVAMARLEDAIEALPAAFELYDADDRVLLSNARMREMYPGVTHLLPQRPTFEALVRANAALGGLRVPVSVDEWLADRLAQRRNPGAPRLIQATDGRWFRLHERRTREGGLVGVRIDVTELIEREQSLQRLNAELDTANRRLAELSETDALTGIANRRQFDRRLAEEWLRALRHGLPLALLLIDVDHFKRFNDRHGHPAGDACLRRIAGLLVRRARRPDELVARFGGEEFVVLLPHTDAEDARVQAERCRDAIDGAAIPHDDSPLGPSVTLSIGIATIPVDADEHDPQQLVRLADAALYRAKREGRHRVVAAPP